MCTIVSQSKRFADLVDDRLDKVVVVIGIDHIGTSPDRVRVNMPEVESDRLVRYKVVRYGSQRLAYFDSEHSSGGMAGISVDGMRHL